MTRTLALAALAAGIPALASAAAPSIPFETYTLDNGLKVILHHDPRLPLVAVSVWYDVGGLHEKAGRSGFAHLFEHMMFQGSQHVPEDQHFAIIQSAGGTDVNGTTDFDRTNYFETLPINQLELGLWLESDRMAYLLPKLTEQSLKNQIEVVKNERRQSVENAPYQLLDEKIVQTVWPAGHPYHGNVIGSMADLDAATIADVQDFWQSYYTPANATLAIGGAFDPATIKGLVNKYFGAIKGRPKPLPPKVEVPKLTGETAFDWDEPVATLPKLLITWVTPPVYTSGTAELDLVAAILAGTRSSRLTAKLVHDTQIAQSVSVGPHAYKAGTLFQVDVVLRPGRTLAEAQKVVEEVIAEFKKSGPTPAELTRAKNMYESGAVSALEGLGGFNGKVEILQEYQHLLGDPGKLAWDLERHLSPTAEDVRAAAERWLGGDRIVARATPRKK